MTPAFSADHFEPVEVLPSDGIFSQHSTSDIANRLGIPVLISRCDPDKAAVKRYNKTIGPGALDNQAATFVLRCQRCIQPRTGSLGFGWAPARWQSEAGSIFVVRRDGKALLPLHAEVLCEYAQARIGPILEDALEDDTPGSRDAAVAEISRASFVWYWDKYLERSGAGTDGIGPYDV